MKMKTRISPAALLTATLCLSGVGRAHAEYIQGFTSDIRVQKDATLDVTETIRVDFEYEKRHGIYRNIPVEYKRNSGRGKISLTVKNVSDEKGIRRNYLTTRQGTDLRIKIGYADRLITGVHTYRIRYLVKGAVTWVKNEPEFSWNVLGNQWPYRADAVTANLYPPAGSAMTRIRFRSFAGPVNTSNPGKNEVLKDRLRFSAKNLQPGSDLTFVARFPARSLNKPPK